MVCATVSKSSYTNKNVQWEASLICCVTSCRAVSSIHLSVRLSCTQASSLSLTDVVTQQCLVAKRLSELSCPYMYEGRNTLRAWCHSNKDGSWSELAELCVWMHKEVCEDLLGSEALQQFCHDNSGSWVTGSSESLQSSHMKTLWKERHGSGLIVYINKHLWCCGRSVDV